MIEEALSGSLTGMAVGEALGIPYNGMARGRVNSTFKPIGSHHIYNRTGLSGANTDLAVMAAISAMETGSNSSLFKEKLASQLRSWVLSVPPFASEGTVQAALKLVFGSSSDKSGSFSAGSSSVMRAAVIGICYSNDATTLNRILKESTNLTHTDPRALYGSIAVALASIFATGKVDVSSELFLQKFQDLTEGFDTYELVSLIRKAGESVKNGERTYEFASSIGLKNGSTPYVYHTVPLVFHAWFSNQTDLMGGIVDLIECGGNTGSMCSLFGAIVGARIGVDGIPSEVTARYVDQVKTLSWLKKLSGKVDDSFNKSRGEQSETLNSAKLFIGYLKIWILLAKLAVFKQFPSFGKMYFLKYSNEKSLEDGADVTSKKAQKAKKKAELKAKKIAANKEVAEQKAAAKRETLEQKDATKKEAANNKKEQKKDVAAKKVVDKKVTKKQSNSKVKKSKAKELPITDNAAQKVSDKKTEKLKTNVPVIKEKTKVELHEEKKNSAEKEGVGTESLIDKITGMVGVGTAGSPENIEVRSSGS